MTVKSWKEVRRIYASGILTGNATFEVSVPDWITWNREHRKDCRLIAQVNRRTVGWVALSKVSGRIVYEGVAEVSIYLDPTFQGQGIGDRLMKALILESERNKIWTLQAGIFPENKVSLSLHLKNGFRIVGTREKLGRMGGVWRDVILVERRSNITGKQTQT